jgi:hypothetical protein
MRGIDWCSRKLTALFRELRQELKFVRIGTTFTQTQMALPELDALFALEQEAVALDVRRRVRENSGHETKYASRACQLGTRKSCSKSNWEISKIVVKNTINRDGRASEAYHQ